MNITPSVSHLWVCALLLLYTLITECPADSDLITSPTVHARIGQSVSLTCQAKGELKVVQSQWNRCPNHTILVYQPTQSHVADESYKDRVSIEKDNSLTIHRVQQGDFGDYCCKLTTYPSGSLEGRVQLLEADEKEDSQTKRFKTMKPPSPSSTPPPTAGLPVMILVYISSGAAGLVVLMGIIFGLVCRKRRRRRRVRNPVYVPVQTSGVPPSQSSVQNPPRPLQKGDPVEVCDEDEDEGMYLNVPQLNS